MCWWCLVRFVHLRKDIIGLFWEDCSWLQNQQLHCWCCWLLLQVELSARLEKERLEARLAEAAAAKQRLEEQLSTAQQVG